MHIQKPPIMHREIVQTSAPLNYYLAISKIEENLKTVIFF